MSNQQGLNAFEHGSDAQLLGKINYKKRKAQIQEDDRAEEGHEFLF